MRRKAIQKRIRSVVAVLAIILMLCGPASFSEAPESAPTPESAASIKTAEPEKKPEPKPVETNTAAPVEATGTQRPAETETATPQPAETDAATPQPNPSAGTSEAPGVETTPTPGPTGDDGKKDETDGGEPSPSATPTETGDAAAGEQTPAPTEPTATQAPAFVLLPRSKDYQNLYLTPEYLDIPGAGMPIPRIYQFNYRTRVCELYGEGKAVSTSGCGAVAASMLIAYLAEDYDQTPYTLFYRAAKQHWYHGEGLGYETIQTLLWEHKVDSRILGVSEDGIRSALEEGRPIIIDMGNGDFTEGEGHYIVLRGLDGEDRVWVNDPNSASNSAESHSISKIIREDRNGWMLVAVNPAPVEPLASEMDVEPVPDVEPEPEMDTKEQPETDAKEQPETEIEADEKAEALPKKPKNRTESDAAAAFDSILRIEDLPIMEDTRMN